MKKLLLLSLAIASTAWAHDHIEVGVDPLDDSRLALDGPGYQLALYVPPGEPFSGYLPQFPGGWHAELTFTAEANALEPAAGADPYIELISVNGPTNGIFAFWEVGATAPTWSRPTGWTNAPEDSPSIAVILGGDNHIHGRAFTMDTPGEYTVAFRAVDATNAFATSAMKTITFVAQLPPRLSMQVSNTTLTLSFTSRLNLDYDLQRCTDLSAGIWISEEILFGDGSILSSAHPIGGPSNAFFRLVEFQ